MEALSLVANPGSASRKYALFAGKRRLVRVHFEFEGRQIVYSCEFESARSESRPANISNLTFAASRLLQVLAEHNLVLSSDQVHEIGLRLVVPSSYFQRDRALSEYAIKRLKDLEMWAPLHINNALQEINILCNVFPKAKLIGVSDSSFHANMPEHARRYAIDAGIADRLDIKRFGYHGLSAEGVVSTLKNDSRLPERLVIAHLGSGVSITAVRRGRSIDTSMGFSPLEGVMMATRSGDIDFMATEALGIDLKLSGRQIQDQLSTRSGLLGVSGQSGDIRELLELEKKGNRGAELALKMYVYRIQQGISRMTASLHGIDALVFTGTVGERSTEIRKRVVHGLMFLGLSLDPHANHGTIDDKLVRISPASNPGKVYIVPTDEDRVITAHLQKI